MFSTISNFLFQAKNSELTVIHEMTVEADTTGYVEPPIDEDSEESIKMEESIPGKGLELPDAIEQTGIICNILC